MLLSEALLLSVLVVWAMPLMHKDRWHDGVNVALTVVAAILAMLSIWLRYFL